MSLAFSDTSTFKGIIQILEKEIGVERGYISGTTNRLKEATADINLAWDEYLSIVFRADGRWQFDDSNHTDYPTITTNLVASQRSYSFTTDQQSNLVLDVHKVAILPSATATLYEEIYPIDIQNTEALPIIASDTATGVPYYYDKLANGIFLDPIPSYNATNGLKIYINREPSYFVSTDTTKKPGCPGIHHRYFPLRAALDYARRNSLTVTNSLYAEVLRMEKMIEEYFSKRAQDERHVMTPKRTNYV